MATICLTCGLVGASAEHAAECANPSDMEAARAAIVDAKASAKEGWAEVIRLRSSLAAAREEVERLTERNEYWAKIYREKIVALEGDIDAIGHAAGICYCHDNGCGGAGPVKDIIRVVEEGRRAESALADARAKAMAWRDFIYTVAGPAFTRDNLRAEAVLIIAALAAAPREKESTDDAT